MASVAHILRRDLARSAMSQTMKAKNHTNSGAYLGRRFDLPIRLMIGGALRKWTKPVLSTMTSTLDLVSGLATALSLRLFEALP